MYAYRSNSAGDFSVSVEDGIATVSVLRGDENFRFKLSAMLDTAGLKRAGDFEIFHQTYYYHQLEQIIEPVATGWFDRLWRKLTGQRVARTWSRRQTVRVEGAQQPLPHDADFFYAYTKVRVPVRKK